MISRYTGLRIDQSRMACLARSRAPSARILAPQIRLPKRTSSDLVLMGDHGKNLPVFGNSFPFRTHRERPAMPQGLAVEP